MTTLNLTLHPSQVMNSNHRKHRMAEATMTKFLRQIGYVAARGMEPIDGKVHAMAYLTFPRLGRRDANNYWPTLKGLFDGIVTAGLLTDDDSKHLDGPDMRIVPERSPKDTVLVEIVLERVS